MEFNLIVGFIIIICVLLVFSLRPRDKYVLTDEFDMEKRKLKPYCSVDEYIHFLELLVISLIKIIILMFWSV